MEKKELIGSQDNPGYGCITPPPAYNPTYNTPPSITPSSQANPGPTKGRVVHVTPTPVVLTAGPWPPTYWGLSLFSILGCFWPLGIAALICSHRTRDAIRYGDLASAEYYSRRAKIYSIWSIVIGIFAIIVTVIVLLV